MQIKILACGLLLAALPASATLIEYTTTNVGGNTWQYEYTVTNDTLDVAIEEFTVFFAHGLFANVVADTTAPAGWDVIDIEPDTGLPDDGFYDALAPLGGGIALGAILGGFTVTADFLGAGAPGAQLWNVVDPLTFATLDFGMTVLRDDPQPVPEPPLLLLLGAGILVALAVRRRRPAAAALAALLAVGITGLAPVASAAISIDDKVLVERVRVDRTVFEYTYQLVVTNNAPVDLTDVTVYIGQRTGSPDPGDAPQELELPQKGVYQAPLGPGTELIDDVVEIGLLPAGQTITTSDTFAIRQDRNFQLDPESLLAETGYTATVTLTGLVTDQPISFAVVEVTVDRGESGRPIIESGRPIIESYSTTADEAGRYSVEVDFVADPDFVSITANGIEQLAFVQLNSIVGSAGRLLDEATVVDVSDPVRNNAVTLSVDSADASALDVTHVSTALTALATDANNGVGFTNDAALAAAQAQVNNDQLLLAAATLKTVIDNPEIALPGGVANTADLLENPDIFSDFVEMLQEDFPVQFQAAIDETIDDINVAYVPADLPPVMYVNLVRANPLQTDSQVITLNQSGSAEHINFNGESTDAGWTVNAEGHLVVDIGDAPILEFFPFREVPPGSGNLVQVRAQQRLIQLVVVRLAVGVQTDQVLLGSTIVTTFPDHVGVLPDEIEVFEPDSNNAYLAFGPDAVLGFLPSELGGRTFATDYYHSVNGSVGTLSTELGADLLTFVADGTGTTARRGFGFTWAIDAGGLLTVTFDNGDQNTFVRYGKLDGTTVDRGLIIGRYGAGFVSTSDMLNVALTPGLAFSNPILEDMKFRSGFAIVDPNALFNFGTDRFDFNFLGGGVGCRDDGFNLAPFEWALNGPGYVVIDRFDLSQPPELLLRRSWQAVAVVAGTIGPRYWVIENRDSVFTSTGPVFPTEPTTTPGRINFYEVIADLTENSPPEAVDDEVPANGYETIFIDVLANDVDIDGDAILLTGVSGSTEGGTVAYSYNSNGLPNGFLYTPPVEVSSETDTFTYTISDGSCNAGETSATVTVNF